ncbi:MAG: hypothetical protein IJL87_07320 [Clostridia bacterium]|nr:hypothetical protein [Clostridia bacterium]
MAKIKTKKSNPKTLNSGITRDIFDVSFFGTKLRVSVLIYIIAAISILSFLLPFTVDTAQSRNLNLSDGHDYKSEVSDIKWNEASSTGFDLSVGRKVPFVKESRKEIRVRLPLTNGYVSGHDSRDTVLYLSYGNLLAIVIPLLGVYCIILMTCRSQWQKGGAFITVALVALASIIIHIIVIRGIATSYTNGKPSSRVLSKRLADVTSKLGVGFYISIFCFAVICALAIYAYIALKAGKGYPLTKAKRLSAEESTEGAAAAAVAE